ncbi:MAG TPA: LacI family DNA-binding transcriptional regulator [Clostridia bacterium]|nr:LacI family DNA-binding transcriptional regulator [Clostridia bacterium]
MANIKDVAKLAGISVTTVSRVLNNKGYISEKTRSSVQKAMEELNYQPNEVARTLFSRQSHLLGLIIPTVAHPFFSQLTRYIEFYASQKGYKVILCNSLMQKEKEKEYLDMLGRHQVDGIIMGSHTLDVGNFKTIGLPVITLDRQISEKIPFVSSDNYSGGILAAEHLIAKGCRHLAHISGNLNLSMLSNRRYDGFKSVCEREHVAYILYQTDANALSRENQSALVEKIFREHPETDGVFASSDLLAAEVLKNCLKHGRKIPEEIKIVGYDDTDLTRYFYPSITSVAQPIESIAKYTVDYLIAEVMGEVVPNQTILEVSLSERETT